MVVGPSGTGKTLLCQMLAAGAGESYPVAMLSSGRLSTRRALLQAILYEVGQPYRGMDEGELRLALVDHLTNSDDCPERPGPAGRRGPHAAAAVVGRDPHADQRGLRRPSPGAAGAGRRQHARRAVRPAPSSIRSASGWSPAATSSRFQSRRDAAVHPRPDRGAGGTARCLRRGGLQAVYQATDGVPRLINQVCDHALLLAYADGQVARSTPAQSRKPGPTCSSCPRPTAARSRAAVRTASASGVIEFGGLDDACERDEEEDSENPTTMPTLRISPDTNLLATFRRREPAEQIERIEAMLAEVEDDLRPAGIIDPRSSWSSTIRFPRGVRGRGGHGRSLCQGRGAVQESQLPGNEDLTGEEIELTEPAADRTAEAEPAEPEFTLETDEVVTTRGTVPSNTLNQ